MTLVTRGGVFQTHGARPAAWLVFAVAWLVGRDFRRRRGEVSLLRDRATRLEREREERARTAVAEERGRIACELHDVVAHSVRRPLASIERKTPRALLRVVE